MKAKIANRLLPTLRPKTRPYEVYDQDLRGFLIRVEPSGAKTYYARYRVEGRRHRRVKIGSASVVTPVQARDIAKGHLAAVVRGEDPAEKKREARAHTLKSFLNEVYEPWFRSNRKSVAPTLRRLRQSFPDFQNKRLNEVTIWLCEKWRSQRRTDGVSIGTCNRDLAALKSALSHATQWGILSENPLAKLKMLPEDRSAKPRYLLPEEETRLIAALDARQERVRQARRSHNAWCAERGYSEWPDLGKVAFVDLLKPLTILALHTGCRRGELFNLTWDAVDFRTRTITVHGMGAKSGQTRVIPLNAVAHDTLKTWREQGSGQGLVFPGKDGKRLDNISTSWEHLMQEANVTNFRFHDLRHTFASRLVQNGVDLIVVKELLGHSDFKLTLRYAHLAAKQKADAVQRLVGNAPKNFVQLRGTSHA